MLEKETGRETSNLSTYISFVTVLPHTSVSATARYRAVKERIMRISDDVRQSRVDARCLFSATHVAALLDGACDHFASASDLPFDLVQESRRRSPVPENLESHITEFVGHGTTQTEIVTFAMPVIGSSLFLDAYPPGAHLFDPVDVFEGLYSDMLNRAFSNQSMLLGGLITAEMCLNGSSIDQAIQRFSILAKQVFHRRRGVRIPFLPSLLRRWIAHGLRYFFPFPQLAQFIDILLCLFADGLYSPANIEEALRVTYHTRGLLDVSHSSATGTHVGLPVATIDKKPLERIFTNYNGITQFDRRKVSETCPCGKWDEPRLLRLGMSEANVAS
ncbi:hypothetical protein VD0002_g10220 [Verticillium dahliae]|nr:hypothetical protein VD0002_g10220 [Verticillium dahliae]